MPMALRPKRQRQFRDKYFAKGELTAKWALEVQSPDPEEIPSWYRKFRSQSARRGASNGDSGLRSRSTKVRKLKAPTQTSASTSASAQLAKGTPERKSQRYNLRPTPTPSRLSFSPVLRDAYDLTDNYEYQAQDPPQPLEDLPNPGPSGPKLPQPNLDKANRRLAPLAHCLPPTYDAGRPTSLSSGTHPPKILNLHHRLQSAARKTAVLPGTMRERYESEDMYSLELPLATRLPPDPAWTKACTPRLRARDERIYYHAIDLYTDRDERWADREQTLREARIITPEVVERALNGPQFEEEEEPQEYLRNLSALACGLTSTDFNLRGYLPREVDPSTGTKQPVLCRRIDYLLGYDTRKLAKSPQALSLLDANKQPSPKGPPPPLCPLEGSERRYFLPVVPVGLCPNGFTSARELPEVIRRVTLFGNAQLSLRMEWAKWAGTVLDYESNPPVVVALSVCQGRWLYHILYAEHGESTSSKGGKRGRGEGTDSRVVLGPFEAGNMDTLVDTFRLVGFLGVLRRWVAKEWVREVVDALEVGHGRVV